VIDLNEPTGWVLIPIKDIHEKPIRTFMIQIAVISNHQNGRDTHMRQIKIHSPMEFRGIGINEFGNFVTVACQQYSCIRWLNRMLHNLNVTLGTVSVTWDKKTAWERFLLHFIDWNILHYTVYFIYSFLFFSFIGKDWNVKSYLCAWVPFHKV